MKDVLCLATGQTYELVLKTGVTAHPAVAPYPKNANPAYIIPIRKGGILEFIFNVTGYVECYPEEVYNYYSALPPNIFDGLLKYHVERNNSFGYGKANTKYRFYFLELNAPIIQTFKKKGIQISTWIDLENIPLDSTSSIHLNSTIDGFETDVSNLEDLYEGHLISIQTNRYERNLIARKKCIEYRGNSCLICGMNFGKRYGIAGEGFIHVHHMKPLHTIGVDYLIDYKNDLIPVCPNCHAMIHRIENGETMTLEELKIILS